MSFSFSCPYCGKQLVAKPSLAGQERTCPQCRATITVPAAAGSAAPRPTPNHGAADHAFLLIPSGIQQKENLIDMTAMVDIVFFLLIFFMVTSIQALESVIDLPSPQSASSAPSAQTAPDYANDPSYITITIEADDTVWVEDEQVFGGQDLRVKLRHLGDEGYHPNSMLVVGHPEASHGTLVMVLDAGADVSMEDVRFSVSEALALDAPAG